MDSYLRRALPLVSWHEVGRSGPFVFMRRGTGEQGFWHAHEGQEDYGGNPMDWQWNSDKGYGAYFCRSCHAILENCDAGEIRRKLLTGHCTEK